MSQLNCEAFWAFSMRHYLCDGDLYQPQERECNKEVLLSLQDDYGFNVNIVLLAMYAGSLNICLTPTHLMSLLHDIKHLDNTTQALRRQRINIAQTTGKDNAQYKHALTSEVESERAQQERLIEKANKMVCASTANTKTVINTKLTADDNTKLRTQTKTEDISDVKPAKGHAYFCQFELLEALTSLNEKTELQALGHEKQNLQSLLLALIERILSCEKQYREVNE